MQKASGMEIPAQDSSLRRSVPGGGARRFAAPTHWNAGRAPLDKPSQEVVRMAERRLEMRAQPSIIFLLLLLLLLTSMASGQEARSTIMGTVTDAQGAVVAGALVTIKNLATNETMSRRTNQTGYYEVPFLTAGRYQVTTEMTGFKKVVRGPVEVSMASSVEINLVLEVGDVAESVTVTAEAPVLETATASAGRLIPGQRIMELPIAWMNPMLLMEQAPAMVSRGNPARTMPWETGQVSQVRTMGNATLAANQFALDGATIGGKDRAVGYIPNLDAVSEFKMELVNFDAAVGHSSGAFVNMATKSGTNRFHGSLFEQHWQQRWNATPHFTRLAWEENVRRSPPAVRTSSGAPSADRSAFPSCLAAATVSSFSSATVGFARD